MDIQAMLKELHTERQQIDEAIAVLEQLANGRGRRRGRPPAWLNAPKQEAVERDEPRSRRQRFVSAETRARMAEAQRRRWANRRDVSAQ